MEAYRYHRKVYYYETDRMGVVHHSNYIRYLEEARIALMDARGVSYRSMEAQGILIPVVSVSCQYARPAAFGDELEVETAITRLTPSRFWVRYVIRNRTAKTVSATAESCHCFTGTDFHPVSLKKATPELYRWFAEQCVTDE